MAPKDIADETGIKDATVRQYLARGLKSGIFIKDATTGNYGLAAGVESPLPVTPAVTPESVTPAVTPPVDDPSMWWIDDK
jgi:DNA-binding transcriptional regulator LsrR (DeoR family)